MKLSILSICLFAITSCSIAQEKSVLPAKEFSEKHEAKANAVLLDVRTPEEFSKGNLGGSVNVNWNGGDFEQKVATMDKGKPVFVYCLAGGRSASAAKKLREMGFTEVYDLEGGIMKWRAAGLPERAGTASAANAISTEQYQAYLNSDKLVLIDFYAEWCGPCKKMKPYLEEIATNMKDKVEIVRINADDNKALCEELKVDALPTLLLYNKKELQWRNVGMIEKQELIKKMGL